MPIPWCDGLHLRFVEGMRTGEVNGRKEMCADFKRRIPYASADLIL